MYWVIAFIRPTAVLTVRKNLENIGILGGTLSEVEGFGRQRGHTEIYRGHEYEVLTSPKVRLEVACSKGELNQAIEAICDGGRSGAGTIGDGKIFVLSLEEAVRIRTGDAGLKAL
jgi:nitrogen regulatory protein P-II 2